MDALFQLAALAILLVTLLAAGRGRTVEPGSTPVPVRPPGLPRRRRRR